MRLIYKDPLYILNKHLIDYPTPSNLNYFWGFGSLAGLCLAMQIVTGILLCMHYTPHVDLAFQNLEHIMRDVNSGWLLRFGHANGASMFFLLIYIHMGRNIYFSSYARPTRFVWNTGVIIFILMMATGFMGYVLPWGQMSFWGATVITSLFTAIPLVGKSVALWLWGGFSVDNPTLNRFFSLHYLLPFVILAAVISHLVFLHRNGSNNPLGVTQYQDVKGFYPYFYTKDLLGFLGFISFYFFIIGFYPDALGHPDNYIEANSLVTPTHIVPEWYFLPFYAILRSVPDKLGGVVLMGLALVILFFLPKFLFNKSLKLKPLSKCFFWFFVFNFLLLLWLGAQAIEQPYIIIAQSCTFFYFFFLIALQKVLAYFERYLLLTSL